MNSMIKFQFKITDKGDSEGSYYFEFLEVEESFRGHMKKFYSPNTCLFLDSSCHICIYPNGSTIWIYGNDDRLDKEYGMDCPLSILKDWYVKVIQTFKEWGESIGYSLNYDIVSEIFYMEKIND